VPLIFILVLKMSVGTAADAEAPPTRNESIGSRQIDEADFTGIQLAGRWYVEMTRGETESIVVEGPEDLLASLSTRKREADTLVMKMTERRRDTRRLRATIVCPSFHSLRTKGVVDLDFSGYDTERLTFRIEGVTTVRAQESRVKDFRLRAEGVSKVDLRDNPVENAKVDCEGVTKLQLTMAGGELTGQMEGVGRLTYGGEVSRVSVHTEGPCKVVQD
jgi:hypothetical protein